ncbi:MAG: hypothetical protein COT25_04780 [Candidatus Kerfeldbacteria bacterium CG08_land_8_20_14_0_20_42_7]|uniref:Glycosyltransferase RgtA/B/C/D-like domain-containing protein n=1 Tax=Candidatus Kerfeldbacteria bacterium CG08_land_8_20_14_0_20_42_7 TaxID=2014245 RepID=A0A2H0YRQ8_9BACT|nr:MAG: hypothetical protein COT25_04780 [Candidatus Kerfeldbacteria bacterium CG08_land_8_20_14_0_20_42_7]
MLAWILEHRFAWGALLLFVVAFSLFVFLSNSSTFADPDSFYHIKLAENIAQGSITKEFRWLPFTTLAEHYTDQHFLYHVFLAPFVKYLGPFTGAKLATTLTASLLIVVFAYVMRNMGMKYPLLWGFLLLTILPFVFRINLAKAPGFSLLILFIGLLCAWKRWHVPLAIVSFVYAWSYGGFILLTFFVIWLSVLRLGTRWVSERMWLARANKRVHISWGIFFKRLFTQPDMYVVYAAILGTVLGVVVSPFFPQNLGYLNDQLIQIGIINYRNIIDVGNEWYPQQLIQLVANTILLTLLAVGAIVWGAIHLKRMTVRTWFLFSLFVFSLLFSLKSQRYVEYYVPLGIAFVASAYSDILTHTNLRKVFSKIFSGRSMRVTISLYAFVIYVIIGVCVVIPRDLMAVRSGLATGFPYLKTRNAALWLKNNTPENSIVVHSDWDEFPYLFMWDDHNRFVCGLDPTFLYRQSPDVYWAWVHFSRGETTENIPEIVTKQLQSNHVLVEKDHEKLLDIMKDEKDFAEVYEDDEASIFEYQGPEL